jgi:hypothetical protein
MHRPFAGALLPLVIAVASTLTFGMNPALAGSTLQLGGTGATGTDPVRIDDSGVVTVLQNSGGAGTLDTGPLSQPWLLILGIPNGPSTNDFFGNTTSSGFTDPITSGNGSLGGTNLYGGAWNKDTGFAGTMTSTTDEAYSTVGLSGTNNSNNFVNWAGADSTYDKITVNNFGIYVFEISATLGPKDTVDVLFSSLPVGTFAIAYGTDGKHVYDTPFTEAGLTTPGGVRPHDTATPVPPSVVLFGLGFVGFLARSRRRLVTAA